MLAQCMDEQPHQGEIDGCHQITMPWHSPSETVPPAPTGMHFESHAFQAQVSQAPMQGTLRGIILHASIVLLLSPPSAWGNSSQQVSCLFAMPE